MTPEEDGELVSDLLQVKQLFATSHLSDVLFIVSSDAGHANEGSAFIAASEDKRMSKSEADHLIPAHRLILSLRSGAFNAAFERAKSSQVPSQVRFPLKIYIQDTPYRVFHAMLRFLYTNELTTPDDGEDEYTGSEQFWQILLRAAFIYLVPSLLHICVKRIKSFLSLSEEIKQDKHESKRLQSQSKTLEILVFTDNVLATNPLTARHRQETHLRMPKGRQSGAEEAPIESSILSKCTEAVLALQQKCMEALQAMDERAFQELVQSEAGGQCSTERLCEILRLRSDTPLVVAVRYQLGRVVNELLRRGEPLNQVGKDETEVPLVAALKTGNTAIIRRLLVDESAPFFLLTDKIPLIFLASASGDVEHCKILIEQEQVDVNVISQLNDGDKEITAEFGHHQTPLHLASRKGHSQVVELLLRHKAAANLPDEEGNTALHYAANLETVEVLLDSAFQTNANIPNRRGRTPLHIAAARGDVATVACLLRHGAEHEIVDDQGQNAVHHAAANGHTAVILVLLQAKHNVKSKIGPATSIEKKEEAVSEEGEALADVEKQKDKEDVQIVRETTDESDKPGGFDINQEDLKGNTALHLAAMSPSERCQKMVQLLLEKGADPNKANWFGYTPLHLFCSHQTGPASLISSFIEHGVNIHVQSLDGSTALHLAVGQGSQDVAIALVGAGAYVHLLDAAGRSVVDLVESMNQGAMLVPVLRNLAHPPEFIGDEHTPECSSCHTAFRLAMRKHHCRHCGRTVCYNCSNQKIAIPKFQILKPDRVCDTCYDVLSFRKLL